MIKSATFCFSVLACLALQGCYTQLAMFYPDPEIESEDEEQFYDTYSRAIPSLKAEAYAQDGRAATPFLIHQCSADFIHLTQGIMVIIFMVTINTMIHIILECMGMG